jgi:hypothetical protein
MGGQKENEQAMTPFQEAQYALDHGIPRKSLSSARAKVEYDRLVAEGHWPLPQKECPSAEGRRQEWTPAGEARYALDYGVSREGLSLEAQIEYDRLVAEGHGTPPQRRPTREERKQARQEHREEAARKRLEWANLAATTTWLPNLGVAIRDGNVYQHSVNQSGMHSDIHAMSERAGRTAMKLLGPLAGAHAEVGGGPAGRRRSGGQRVADTAFNTLMLGPAGLLSAASRKGFEVFAVVSFADGNVWEKTFDKKSTNASLLIKAQSEAVRFNAMAASGQPDRGVTSGPAEDSAHYDTGVAAELERLAALHSSGMLDDEEFRAAKARIIHGG